MSLTIERLLRGQDPRALHEFLERNDFPLVEGSTVTFVFHGNADEVRLHHWVAGLPSAQPFQRQMGSPLWYVCLEIPPQSRVEYKLEVVHRGRRQLIRDPMNPRLARDPFGANSVVFGEGYETPEWTQEDPEARRGTVEDHAIESAAFGGSREVQVYVPARFRPRRRYPLLIVHDGADYLRFTALQTVLDNLIDRLEIPPMIVALTQSPDRLVEYAADPRHAQFITCELLPWLEERYPLFESPQFRGLMGASFGAVAALSTAWRQPGVFGQLLLQSGSFAFTDVGEHDFGEPFDPVVEWMSEFREEPGQPGLSAYLSCGTFERNIYLNRSILPVLQSTGMSVRLSEARDGHNWENWRDRLREGLTWLFPGPLWMVYE